MEYIFGKYSKNVVVMVHGNWLPRSCRIGLREYANELFERRDLRAIKR
jgi:hypothetical protein